MGELFVRFAIPCIGIGVMTSVLIFVSHKGLGRLYKQSISFAFTGLVIKIKRIVNGIDHLSKPKFSSIKNHALACRCTSFIAEMTFMTE